MIIPNLSELQRVILLHGPARARGGSSTGAGPRAGRLPWYHGRRGGIGWSVANWGCFKVWSIDIAAKVRASGAKVRARAGAGGQARRGEHWRWHGPGRRYRSRWSDGVGGSIGRAMSHQDVTCVVM